MVMCQSEKIVINNYFDFIFQKHDKYASAICNFHHINPFVTWYPPGRYAEADFDGLLYL